MARLYFISTALNVAVTIEFTVYCFYKEISLNTQMEWLWMCMCIFMQLTMPCQVLDNLILSHWKSFPLFRTSFQQLEPSGIVQV